MIFSSYAIVFSNSGNNLSNIKSNNNLNIKSFVSGNNKKIINLVNAHNDLNSPIEFYDNFMIYDNSNNQLTLVNLTDNTSIITNITYSTEYNSFYYGIIVNYGFVYIYALYFDSSNYPYLELDNYTQNLKLNIYNSYEISTSGYSPIGISANNLGIYVFLTQNGYNSGRVHLLNYVYAYSQGTVIKSYRPSNGYTTENWHIQAIVNNGFYYIYGYNSVNSINEFVNLYNNSFTNNTYDNNATGELIYNNNYTNNFKITDSSSINNTYNSNGLSFGYYYSNFYTKTSNYQDFPATNYRENGNSYIISFANENFFNNMYAKYNINNSKYCLIYKGNNYGLNIKTFDLPYTITNNNIYYAINSTAYGIYSIINYKLNITSYNHNSNQIKDYFFYNNNIYYGNQFNFTNSNGIFSILPLNYSIYTYNKSYIITTSSEFKDIGNGIYQYNLSIYYNELSTNTTSSIKPLDISSYIYPIGIIIFVSFLGAMVYFSKSEGKK